MPGIDTEKVVTTTTTEEVFQNKALEPQGFIVTTDIKPIQEGFQQQGHVNNMVQTNNIDDKLLKQQEIIRQETLIKEERLRQKELQIQTKITIDQEKSMEKETQRHLKEQDKEYQRQEKDRLKLEKKLLKQQHKHEKEVEKTHIKEIKTQEKLQKEGISQVHGQTTTIDPMLASQRQNIVLTQAVPVQQVQKQVNFQQPDIDDRIIHSSHNQHNQGLVGSSGPHVIHEDVRREVHHSEQNVQQPQGVRITQQINPLQSEQFAQETQQTVPLLVEEHQQYHNKKKPQEFYEVLNPVIGQPQTNTGEISQHKLGRSDQAPIHKHMY